MRVQLHLRLRIIPAQRPALLAFLQKAIPVYEAPGGIRVRLLECRGPGETLDAPDTIELLELVEYETAAAYEADQGRVAEDSVMRALLDEWRGILAEPPEVVVFTDVSGEISTAREVVVSEG